MLFIEDFVGEAKNEPIKCLFFGLDGVGKTTLATTLPVQDDKRLTYINVDPGELTFKKYNRHFRRLSAPNGIWTEEVLEAIYTRLVELATNKEIDYIFVDGLNVIGDALLENEKETNITKSGEINMMKAYGEMADKFKSWCKRVRDINGVSVIMLTHESVEEDPETGRKVIRADFPGKKVKGEINRWFDIIGYMYFSKNEVTGEVERVITCNPQYNPTLRVKDRSGVLGNVEPADLGKIFDRIEKAGFSTSNNDDRLINQTDIKVLATWAKDRKISRADLNARATQLFDSVLENLTISELEKVKESFNS